ncbi:hypothetical protein GJ744_006309 [Endocarpon pusillum]|uniref:NACHT domain-containing protein n=1 Tax=Endocarpon pusillum TaxID=364733 RepID=A0A8H7A4Y7_9EURO|nr:hypothetical protein GJ744_006309 [Endocarpon pusillum]
MTDLSNRLQSSKGLASRPFPTKPNNTNGESPVPTRDTKSSSANFDDIVESSSASCIISSSVNSGNKRQFSRQAVSQPPASNPNGNRVALPPSFNTSSPRSMNSANCLSAKSDGNHASLPARSVRSASQPGGLHKPSAESSKLPRTPPPVQKTASEDVKLTTPSRTDAHHRRYSTKPTSFPTSSLGKCDKAQGSLHTEAVRPSFGCLGSLSQPTRHARALSENHQTPREYPPPDAVESSFGCFKHPLKLGILQKTRLQTAKATPTKLAHRSKPYGLKTFAEGANPVLDIVAVHGLNGNREKTWAAGDVCWLRDFLPLEIPKARILSWGYDANTHGTLEISNDSLYYHAKNLISDLCLMRDLTKTQKRPILFIAHSLGGIVVKSALIYSDAARKGNLEKHQQIKLSTYGIFFMGTPHQGGNGVRLGRLVLNIASVFVKTDDRILKHLKHNSEWLQQLQDQYNSISRDFVTKFAYETLRTQTVLRKSIMIVPRFSAVIAGAADAESVAINADHINMVKFASREDDGYKKISGHLQLLAQEAPHAVGARWAKQIRIENAMSTAEDSEWEQRLTKMPDSANRTLASLRPEVINTRYMRISDAYTGTFEWIFKEEVTPFKTWLEYSNGVFWISGKAGSGKSTLMKYLCSHPETHDILRKWGGGDVVVASFFFWNTGVKMEKTQQGLLQSLLYQVLRRCPELIKDILPQQRIGDPLFRDLPTLWKRQELLTALKSALTHEGMRRKFCFFIDGLDEHSEDHYDLIQALKTLMWIPSLKLCVSSRPWNVFKKAYGASPERMIRLQDLTLADIAVYVKGALENDDRFLALTQEEAALRLLVKEITHRAEGVFLWVHLVTKSLLRGLTEHDDMLMLQKRLNEFPTDLEAYFQHMLDTTETVYKACTARALLLALYTHNNSLPMHVVLPVIALSYLPWELEDPNFALKTPLNPIPLNERRLRQKKSELCVNAWCRDLLEIHQSEDFPTKLVTFAHRTVKDFLDTPDMQASLFKSAGPSFRPWESLCRLNFAWLKCLDITDGDLEAVRFIFQIEAVTHLMERYEERSPIKILHQLSDAHFQALLLLTLGSRCMGVEFREPLSAATLCLGLGIYHELELFVRHELKELKEHNKFHDAQEKAFLLYCGLDPISKGHEGIFSDRANGVLSIALNLGANPNIAIFRSRSQFFSPWRKFLQDISDMPYHILKCQKHRIDDFTNILLVLLQQGADPEAIIEAHYTKNNFFRYPFADEVEDAEAEQEVRENMTARECIRWLLLQLNLTHRFPEIEKLIK